MDEDIAKRVKYNSASINEEPNDDIYSSDQSQSKQDSDDDGMNDRAPPTGNNQKGGVVLNE